MEHCETCRYYLALASECHRHPPTAHVLMATGRIAGTGEAKILGVFPGTKPSNWCGEYGAAEVAPERVE